MYHRPNHPPEVWYVSACYTLYQQSLFNSWRHSVLLVIKVASSVLDLASPTLSCLCTHAVYTIYGACRACTADKPGSDLPVTQKWVSLGVFWSARNLTFTLLLLFVALSNGDQIVQRVMHYRMEIIRPTWFLLLRSTLTQVVYCGWIIPQLGLLGEFHIRSV